MARSTVASVKNGQPMCVCVCVCKLCANTSFVFPPRALACPLLVRALVTQVAGADKDYTDRPDVSRIASSNGAWDHLAVNKLATVPMGTGTAPALPTTRSPSSMLVRGTSSTSRPGSHTSGPHMGRNGKDVGV